LAHLALVNSRFHCPLSSAPGLSQKKLVRKYHNKSRPIFKWCLPSSDHPSCSNCQDVCFNILDTFLERLSNPIFKTCVDIVGHMIVGIVGSEPAKRPSYRGSTPVQPQPNRRLPRPRCSAGFCNKVSIFSFFHAAHTAK
jgi:hypothetical protein